MNVCPPIPDALDQRSLLEGAKFRFARENEVPKEELLAELRLHVRKELRNFGLKPIPYQLDLFTPYIEQTHYNSRRKQHLTDIYNQKFLKCGWPDQVIYKSFGKVEFMHDGNKYKYPRIINPPDDWYKVAASPYIHAVETEVCKLKYFAKYVPVIKRPEYIKEMFSQFSGIKYVTDYTSFESGFVPAFYDCVERELYEYMLSEYPEAAAKINEWNSGIKQCIFREFRLEIAGIRMSGDPNTSLGNGFSNLMLTSFIAKKADAQFVGIVEGDDGLFCFNKDVNFAIAKELGFVLKLEPHEDIYTTSFCGLLLSHSLAAFSEPRYAMAAFGWTQSQLRFGSKKVRMGLLRSKALSLVYCNPRCPILTALGERYVELTEGYEEVLSNSYWDQKVIKEKYEYSDLIKAEKAKGLSLADRFDFERMFNVSVDTQLRIEKYLKTAGLGPLDCPDIDLLYDSHPVFRDFDEKYCGYHARPFNTANQIA